MAALKTNKRRTAKLVLLYNGVDISADISGYLVSASYVDNTGQADELTVNLEDSDRLWQGSWYPQKGAKLIAYFETEYFGVKRLLTCGTFEIDEIELGGPPDVVVLKAISTMVTGTFKKEKKSRGWETISLEKLASDLASEHGLTAFWSVKTPVQYERVDQREESDLAFLRRLCDDGDLDLKISGEKLIIFEGKELEAAPPAFAIVRGKSSIASFSFRDKTAEIYRGAEISYQDVEKKELMQYTFIPPNAPSVGEILKINKRAENYADAKKKAEAMLRRKNKMEGTASFELFGDTMLLAGLTGVVVGWGQFDGKHIADTATHTVDRTGGYTTSLELRKVLAW